MRCFWRDNLRMLWVIHGYLFLLVDKILDGTQFKHSKHTVLNSSHRRLTGVVCEVLCKKVEENSDAIFLITAKFIVIFSSRNGLPQYYLDLDLDHTVV